MDQTEKKNKQDMESTILKLHEVMGTPIIVSLLVDVKGISIISCNREESFKDYDSSEEPTTLEPITTKNLLSNRLNYMG